jgi:long-chain fatty acid transport protein
MPERTSSVARVVPRLAVVSLWGLSLLAFLAPVAALASGFAIYEQSVHAIGTGGAFTARASDASAVYFNPAAIMDLEGVQVMAGSTAIFLYQGWSIPQGDTRHEQVNSVGLPFFAYATQRVNDRWGWGAGVNCPAGLKTEWGSDFPGRFISRESSIAVINANLDLAVAVGRGWSVAAGLDGAFADIKTLSRNIDLTALGAPGVEGTSTMSGDGTKLGWNAALRWAGASGWRWGGSFRSAVKPHLTGQLEFSGIPAGLQPLFPDGPGESDLPLPATFSTGVAYVSPSGWEGEFDVVWTGWSDFEQLQIDFENNTWADPGHTVPIVADVAQSEDWSDSYAFRAGVERHLAGGHTLRAGAYLDKSPIADDHLRPRLPDGDRRSVQAGYGYQAAAGWGVDAVYQAIFVEDRQAVGSPTDPANPVLPAEYGNFISRVGLALSWRF